MAKIPVIHKCMECERLRPNCSEIDTVVIAVCDETGKEVKDPAGPIPSWCPLPDAPGVISR